MNGEVGGVSGLRLRRCDGGDEKGVGPSELSVEVVAVEGIDEDGNDNAGLGRVLGTNRPRESLKGALEARVRPQKREILEGAFSVCDGVQSLRL